MGIVHRLERHAALHHPRCNVCCRQHERFFSLPTITQTLFGSKHKFYVIARQNIIYQHYCFSQSYAYCEAKTGLLADLFWKRIKPSMYSRCCLNIPSETFSDDLHHEIWWQGGRLEPILAPADKTCIISIPLLLPLLVVLLLPLPASV